MALLTIRQFALMASFSLLSPLCPAGDNSDRLEYQVKSAFLFNFLKFIEWPAPSGTTPWVIGILGRDPFNGVLEETVRGKVWNGRPVEIRHFAKLSDVKDCHILFVGSSASGRLAVPLQAGLLTVGEDSGFIKSGGIINFYLEDNRVHFEINPAGARSAGLRVGAQLLKLGKIQ